MHIRRLPVTIAPIGWFVAIVIRVRALYSVIVVIDNIFRALFFLDVVFFTFPVDYSYSAYQDAKHDYYPACVAAD